jgi:hypothetical protein
MNDVGAKQPCRRFAGVCLFAALAATWCFASAPPPPRVLTEAEIKRLVAALGSECYSVREAATRALRHQPEARPALSLAVKSGDAEVRRRAGRLLDALDRLIADRGLERARRYAEEGRLDLAVELLVHWRKSDHDGRGGQILTGLVEKLLALDRRRFGPTPWRPMDRALMPAGSFTRYLRHVRPQETDASVIGSLPREAPSLWFRGERLTVRPEAGASLLCCSGQVDAFCLGCSAVFAGDSFKSYGGVHLVIVSDGDVTVGNVGHALLIARGAIRVTECATHCRAIAGGRVSADRPKSLAHVSIRENDQKPLGFVRFFDLSEQGIEVAGDRRGSLRIQKVCKGLPFDRAGLRAGDLILTAEGRPAESVEAFRRLVRRHVACSLPLSLRVKRAGKELALSVR